VVKHNPATRNKSRYQGMEKFYWCFKQVQAKFAYVSSDCSVG